MSVIVPFQPSGNAPFSFQAAFDGASYQCTVPWNYAGQRYYLTVRDSAGALVYNLPLVESAPNRTPINLNAGYFTTPIYFSGADQQFVIG